MMAKHIFAELDALGDGSTNSIYLGEQIVSRPGRVRGHLGRSGRHIGSLEFGNSGCDGTWGGQIGSSLDGSAAESTEDSIRVVSVVKCMFAKLNALGDGSTDAIYLGE